MKFLDHTKPVERRPVLMTLFVDASLCSETGASGWGAWAKRYGWSAGRQYSGMFSKPMLNSGDAEIAGIFKAVRELFVTGAMEGVSEIMVQCDNLRALTILKTELNAIESKHEDGVSVPTPVKSLDLSEVEKISVEHLRRLTNGKIVFLVRHVRGHQTGSTRHSVNGVCDVLAKKHMRRARNLLKAGKSLKH